MASTNWAWLTSEIEAWGSSRDSTFATYYNQPNKDANTLLHVILKTYLIKHGQKGFTIEDATKVISAIVSQKGLDKTLKNIDGKTVLDIVIENSGKDANPSLAWAQTLFVPSFYTAKEFELAVAVHKKGAELLSSTSGASVKKENANKGRQDYEQLKQQFDAQKLGKKKEELVLIQKIVEQSNEVGKTSHPISSIGNEGYSEPTPNSENVVEKPVSESLAIKTSK